MRLLLADDHALFAEGLKNLLVSRGIEVVGVAADGREALEMARATRPDVILMDVLMPECDGIEATRLIKAELPDAKVVMLSVSDSEAHLFAAIRGGASGYLLKDLNADELLARLSDVARGGTAFSPGMGAKVLREFAVLANVGADAGEDVGAGEGEGLAVDERLTGRQTAVLGLVAKGMTYAEVGVALSITERTVKYHMREIMERLGLANRAQVLAHVGRTRSGLPGSSGTRGRPGGPGRAERVDRPDRANSPDRPGGPGR